MKRFRNTAIERDEAGFTLVELLMVMVIIGILAGIGVSGFSSLRSRADQAEADAAWRELNMAVNLYRVDEGGWPTAYMHAKDLGFLDNPWGPLETNLAPPDAGDPDRKGADPDGGPTDNEKSGHLILEEGVICVWSNGQPSNRNDENDCP